MNSITKTVSDSFLKIVTFGSNTYKDLNGPEPSYGDRYVDIINITPVGTDANRNPLFCYELKFYNKY